MTQPPPIVPGTTVQPPGAPPEPATVPVGRPRWIVPLVAILVVVAAGSAGIAAWALTRGTSSPAGPSASPPAAEQILHGTVTLLDFDGWNRDWNNPELCSGDSGYDDISKGAQIVVTGPDGKVVSTGSLSSGVVVGQHDGCKFSFTLSVPGGLAFYGVAIGSRKPHQVDKSRLADSIDLTLG
jgi:hypothetical protein